jgi:hypothetical protein
MVSHIEKTAKITMAWGGKGEDNLHDQDTVTWSEEDCDAV